MAWNVLNTKTLTGTADDITTDVFEVKKYLQIIGNVISSNVTDFIDFQQRFGDTTIDTANSYSRRQSVDGGATSASFPRSNIDSSSAVANTQLMIANVVNLNGLDILENVLFVNAGAVGASNAPSVSMTWGKWESSTPMDIAQIYNSQAGDYNTDSNLTVFGTD